jgi:hypothetical protein
MSLHLQNSGCSGCNYAKRDCKISTGHRMHIEEWLYNMLDCHSCVIQKNRIVNEVVTAWIYRRCRTWCKILAVYSTTT